MFSLIGRPRARGARPEGFARLRLEWLESRDCPSTPGPSDDPPPPGEAGPSAQVGSVPVISTFQATELSPGYFYISGNVRAVNPAGMIVSFGGSVGPVSGLSTTVRADGSFGIYVTLKTDGTDAGTITATTSDANGTSQEVWVDVNPTLQ